jgi:DedD protein
VDERLKRRLIGATVLMSLVVIFVPMLFEEPHAPPPEIRPDNLPAPPLKPFESSRVLPLSEEKPVATVIGPPRPEPAPSLPAPVPLLPKTPPPEVAVAPHPRVAAPPETPVTTPKVPPQTPPMPPKPHPGLTAWVVQVGAFANKETANNLVAKLKADKLTAYMEEVQVSERTLYRVRVGPDADRRNAEQTAVRIGKKFKVQGAVVQYP